MAACHHHVFETAYGFAAIGWNDRGIASLRLPAATPREAELALLRRLPTSTLAEPPPSILGVVEAATRYFHGERMDFSDVPIDLGEQDEFAGQVYALVRRLGWGETTTYGAVAKRLGAGPEAARDVGQAMARNPVPLIVPCHRVTGAGGKIGGFSAPGGSVAKARMLLLEGFALPEPSAAPPPSQASFGF